MKKDIYFTLILATLGRKKELYALFDSLVAQEHQHFTVLVVDQNPTGFLDNILKSYEDRLRIVVVRSAPGLSRARNVALNHIEGNAFALTDDDCIYAANTLALAALALQKSDIVIGNPRPLTELTQAQKQVTPFVIQGRQHIFSVFRDAPSYVLFFKKNVACKVGLFDENIGIGSQSPYGSGEETDYLIRAIKEKFIIERQAIIKIYHPTPDYATASIKAKTYGRGRRYIIQKNKLGFHFLLLNIIFSFFSCIGSFPNFHKMRWHWNLFLGRLGC